MFINCVYSDNTKLSFDNLSTIKKYSNLLNENNLNEIICSEKDVFLQITNYDDIIEIEIKGCNLPEIPISLPKNLVILDCNENMFKKIPNLPDTLKELYCGINLLEELPDLPDSLEILNCGCNKIKSLPKLSKNLKELDFFLNEVEEISNLPDKLEILCSSDNHIHNILEFPDSLIELYCNSNELLYLPKLPNNLQILCCLNNKLSNIEILPISLKLIDISRNNIKSISNDLLNCRNLEKINISNNPLELTIQQQNFVIWVQERNRQINMNRNYFKDGQNVHNSHIQKSIRKSIENLMNFQ